MNNKARVSDETFDQFLAEQGILEVCEQHALKTIIATQVAQAMTERRLDRTAMAACIAISRGELDRLLDPATESVAVETLRRAAIVVDSSLRAALD